MSEVGGASAAVEEQDDAAAAVSSSPNNSSGSFPTDYSAQGQAGPGGAGAADRSSSRASDEDDGGSVRKKLRLSKEQSAFLEESFKEHATLNPVSIHLKPNSDQTHAKLFYFFGKSVFHADLDFFLLNLG